MRNTISTLLLLGSSLSLSAGSIQFSGNKSIPSSDLMDIRVPLGQSDGEFIPDPNGIPMPLEKMMPEYLSKDAIDTIIQQISAAYQEREILAVRVDVTRTAYDAAKSGGDLVIRITEGSIAEARVVSMDPEVYLPDSVAERILEAAPIKAADKVDGRRLDTSIGSMNRFSPDYVQPVLMSTPQGDLEIEYRVAVGERLGISYGVDNYGSESTGETRQTLEGYANRVFTSADRFDLSGTMSFEESSYFIRGEYFLPLDGLAHNRLRFSAYHSSFQSDEIGVLLLDYEGQTSGAILGYERTLWVGDAAYLDFKTGVHYMHANQDNSSFGIQEQDSDFILPFAELALSHANVDRSWLIGLKVEGNLADVAGTGDQIELARMGRLEADRSFFLGSFYSGYRTYLDSIFSQKNRRAHELLLSGSARTSFGSRLPANFLNVLGGHDSIRGYSVAAASGDSSLFTKVDYRMHLNRYLGTKESEARFRARPRFVGDIPSVDFSFGMFTDYGIIDTVDAFAFEESGDLWSAGVGFYGKAGKYLDFSTEYAWVLKEYGVGVDREEVGDGKFYFSVDLKY